MLEVYTEANISQLNLEDNINQKKVIKVLPSVLAESVYMLDGKPFRLTNRDYLKPIYDGEITEGILMCGRQVEKSTTNSVSIANYTLLVPFFKALYVAPLTDQIREFSKERLGKLYEYSQKDVVKKYYIDKNCSQAVQFKTFTNGSVNYFKHCYDNGDNIRGITVNGVWIDEVQDIHIDAIPVIKETQSHALDTGAKIKVIWYTGTPKTYNNTIQQYFDRSTQNEWVIKCPHCNLYQILSIKNLSPNAYLCRKCRKVLPKESILNGRWIEMKPGAKIKGFRISQLMVPWITPEEIWDKYISYPPAKFHNEVLGRSYENAEKPFNHLILSKMSENNFVLYNRAEREFANTYNFMGVDWGSGERSSTVVIIGVYNKFGQFQIIYAKKFDTGQELDPEYQIKYIANLMNIFKIAYAIVDWGFGYVQYKKLQNLFGNRVAACYYSFNQKDEHKWDGVNGRWVVNRTKVIQKYVFDCHALKIIFPGADKDKISWLYDHHLAEMTEYRKSQNGKSEELMFTHPENQPDDGLHACVYCYLAAQLFKPSNISGGIQFYTAYGNNI